jgi:hypothetical protein
MLALVWALKVISIDVKVAAGRPVCRWRFTYTYRAVPQQAADQSNSL